MPWDTGDVQEELRTAREALTQDRATLATTLRTAQTKEEGLEDVLGRLRAENEMLNAQVREAQAVGLLPLIGWSPAKDT
jgi:chromosome segregation ATPase